MDCDPPNTCVLVKHLGHMYVWRAHAWYDRPTHHVGEGRELVTEGDYRTLRNIADIHNSNIKENANGL